MEEVRLWPPNTLPIPFPLIKIAGGKAEKVEEEVIVDMEDSFPKGRIHRYFPNQGYGFLQDRAGREIYFSLDEVDFVGLKGKDSVKVGSAIGYDISESGRGPHVRKMKIY